MAIIFILTFVIHIVGTLAYSVRIAGTRTGRIALSFSLYNVLMLISRTSNSFQGPLLGKRIESNLLHGVSSGVVSDFRWLLLAAALATVVGGFFIPTFQRLFSKAVNAFTVYRSIPKLLMEALTREGISHIAGAMALPSKRNIVDLSLHASIPIRVIVLNVAATAIWTVGVFSALYAGYLNPDLRVTSNNLSSIINGLATILMFVFIDPYLSMLTDDVVAGKLSEPAFRRSIVWLVGSRLAGTLLAQALLKPAAGLIVLVAKHL